MTSLPPVLTPEPVNKAAATDPTEAWDGYFSGIAGWGIASFLLSKIIKFKLFGEFSNEGCFQSLLAAGFGVFQALFGLLIGSFYLRSPKIVKQRTGRGIILSAVAIGLIFYIYWVLFYYIKRPDR